MKSLNLAEKIILECIKQAPTTEDALNTLKRSVSGSFGSKENLSPYQGQFCQRGYGKRRLVRPGRFG
jgi:hypothetical protein